MTARLMFPWNRWVHRRVERATFCDEDAVHRDVSIDFTLPYWFHQIRKTSENEPKRQLVPIGFLSKGALINFSLRDEHDSSLPLLNKSQNAQVAAAVLISVARSALDIPGDNGQDVPDEIECDIRHLVSQPSGDAFNTLKQLFDNPDAVSAVREKLRGHRTFVEIATQFAKSFLAFSMLNIRPHERRIVHLSHEARLIDNRIGGFVGKANRMRQLSTAAPRFMVFYIPSVSEAASYHLEVEAPEGHMISGLDSFRYQAGSTGQLKPEPVRGTFRRAHFHFANVSSRRVGSVLLYLYPRQSGVVRIATLTGLIALLSTLIVTLRYLTIINGHGNETAATLLLAATGLVGFALVRSGESEIATALLFPLRLVAALPVFLAVVAAMVLVYQPSSVEVAKTTLWLCTAASFVSVLVVSWNWYISWRESKLY
jgi:hypothetical protein